MNEMLMSGVELMLVGMGIVYLFLAMLVVAIKLMSVFVENYLPSPVTPANPGHRSRPKESIDAPTIAAISAAIHQYRNGRK